LLRSFPSEYPHCRIIRFSRNFGQQQALAAGIQEARGTYVCFLDADLQVAPEDIPLLLEKADEGYDVVAGIRQKRADGFVTRKIPSLIVNAFWRVTLKLPYKDIGCGLQVFRLSTLEGIDPLSHVYGYREVYAVWRGSKFATVTVNYQERQHGTTKYSFFDLVYLFLDTTMTFLTQPLQLVLFFLLGAIVSGSTLLIALGLGIKSLSGTPVNPVVWLLILIGFTGGILIAAFGLINERISRVDHRVNNTPLFVIEEIIENS
ncbi:glycosyltransferase, partial [bacterium]|nr:glycosyltransferase [candidate division CSSED10-310 bacterium]